MNNRWWVIYEPVRLFSLVVVCGLLVVGNGLKDTTQRTKHTKHTKCTRQHKDTYLYLTKNMNEKPKPPPHTPSQYQPAQLHKPPLWWCGVWLRWWTDPVTHTHTHTRHHCLYVREPLWGWRRSLPCRCRCRWPDLDSWWPLKGDRQERKEERREGHEEEFIKASFS